MLKFTLIFVLLPIFATCSNDGNIHLLEEDISVALMKCYDINNANLTDDDTKRLRRSSDTLNVHGKRFRVDVDTKQGFNENNHVKGRNTSLNRMHVLNASNSDKAGDKSIGKKLNNVKPRPAFGTTNKTITADNYRNSTRTKRQEPLISKDKDQCLSQCVFANLHVVDSKGIPREPELWNKVQMSVTSQQSRAILKNQIRACFQELQSESEDNSCSYSNKLERCLMLRVSDREIKGKKDKN